MNLNDLDIIEQIHFINEKLKEGYSLSRLDKDLKSSDKVVSDDLKIHDFEGEVVTRSYKIYEPIQKEFAEYCSSSKYRVQDLISQALKEFLEKYR